MIQGFCPRFSFGWERLKTPVKTRLRLSVTTVIRALPPARSPAIILAHTKPEPPAVARPLLPGSTCSESICTTRGFRPASGDKATASHPSTARVARGFLGMAGVSAVRGIVPRRESVRHSPGCRRSGDFACLRGRFPGCWPLSGSQFSARAEPCRLLHVQAALTRCKRLRNSRAKRSPAGNAVMDSRSDSLPLQCNRRN